MIFVEDDFVEGSRLIQFFVEIRSEEVVILKPKLGLHQQVLPVHPAKGPELQLPEEFFLEEGAI